MFFSCRRASQYLAASFRRVNCTDLVVALTDLDREEPSVPLVVLEHTECGIPSRESTIAERSESRSNHQPLQRARENVPARRARNFRYSRTQVVLLVCLKEEWPR